MYDLVVHGRAKGVELENLVVRHPFYAEREIPILLGEHVSDEDGTGNVHTAPGHGQEDFAVARHYGLLDKLDAAVQIGRAHVCTPVTNAHLVCRLLLEKKKNIKTYHKS